MRRITQFTVILGVCTALGSNSAQAQSPAVAATKSVQFTGVNIADPAFGHEHLPGIHGQHYKYPGPSTIDYFAAKGMNIIRLAVRWERLQHRLEGELATEEMQRLDAVVRHATASGLRLIIDVHNYAKYRDVVIGAKNVTPKAFGDLWRRLAARYKDNDLVVFNLMNEPNGLRTETWLEATNAAIAEIRKAGAKNLLLIPGNGWTAARQWVSGNYGTPNAKVMLKVADPAENYVYDVHQYFNRDFTGTQPDCRSTDIGIVTLTPFTRWARENGKRGFLGEFGVGTSPVCLEALDNVLRFMAENNDVWLGWTYWAAGEWWAKDYFSSIQPIEGLTRPQMPVLEKYLRPKR